MFLKIIWSVIARYFADNEYVLRDDNTPIHRARITENYKQENNINCTTRSAVSGLRCVQKCLASHKEGTTASRWKHQHPKRTCCQFSTCVGKSPRELYSGTLSNQSNMDT